MRFPHLRAICCFIVCATACDRGHPAPGASASEVDFPVLVGIGQACDAIRASVYRRQRFVLQRLAALDEHRCVSLLRPVLAKLPSDVEEPYWTCEAAYYSQVVVQVHDDGIWKEYLKIAKRAAVGLRMEMMNVMDQSCTRETNVDRWLVFLAAFLDDAIVRESVGKKYEGPCAAFWFPTIQVRDFAAMQIAWLLGFDERPNEFWTEDDWTQLRNKVRTALNKRNRSTRAGSP